MKPHRFLPCFAAAALAVGLLSTAPPASAARHQHPAWVTSNHIQVIDLDTAKVVGKIPLTEFIHDLQFSPDGTQAYVASSKGLRVADANTLRFIQRASERSTRALGVSADGKRVVALHGADSEATLAARKAKAPLPPSEVVLYDSQGMTVESRWQVPGMALDVEISPDGATVYVLVPPEGTVQVHQWNGTLVERIQLVEPSTPDGRHEVMMSWMAQTPDGSTIVVPASSAESSFLLQIDLSGVRSGKDRILNQGLGHRRRIQGLAWDDDGSNLWVTAINASVKFNGHGLPIAWQRHEHNFVDLKPVPGTDHWVSVTPTLSEQRGSGGVAILDEAGAVLRTVELQDMSPFRVAVRP